MYAQPARNKKRSVRNEHHSGLLDYEDYGDIQIRRFRPEGEDERQMRDLVFDNAFLGKPFDEIFSNKEWFGDVVLTPYIKHQPENIHVATHKGSGRLIGYLTGSMGGQPFEQAQYNWVRRQVIFLAVSLSMPWSFFDHSSRVFAAHVIFKGESERPGHPETGVHWHFQVDKEFRGQGVGGRLLRRFTNDAVAADFDLIWAEVMAYPEKPPEYFESRGWSIYDARPTLIFGDHVDFPVQVLSISRSLGSFEPLTQAG
jgi:GNAT superfamily N-acetyltransferase